MHVKPSLTDRPSDEGIIFIKSESSHWIIQQKYAGDDLCKFNTVIWSAHTVETRLQTN